MLTKEFLESQSYELIAELSGKKLLKNVDTKSLIPEVFDIVKNMSSTVCKENAKVDSFKNYETKMLFNLLTHPLWRNVLKSEFVKCKEIVENEGGELEVISTNHIREFIKGRIQDEIEIFFKNSVDKTFQNILINNLLKVDWHFLANYFVKYFMK